jgi:hypothetical protein
MTFNAKAQETAQVRLEARTYRPESVQGMQGGMQGPGGRYTNP